VLRISRFRTAPPVRNRSRLALFSIATLIPGPKRAKLGSFGAPASPDWLCFTFLVRFDHLHFEFVSSFEPRASDFPVPAGPAVRDRARLALFCVSRAFGSLAFRACFEFRASHFPEPPGPGRIGFVWRTPLCWSRPGRRAGFRSCQPVERPGYPGVWFEDLPRACRCASCDFPWPASQGPVDSLSSMIIIRQVHWCVKQKTALFSPAGDAELIRPPPGPSPVAYHLSLITFPP